MTIQFNTKLANLVDQISNDKLQPSELTATDSYKLTKLGCLDLDEKGRLHLTVKGEKLLNKFNKKANEVRLAGKVGAKMTELLTEPGQLIKHRAVWEAMGRDEYTRNEVLVALRMLRATGFLKNIKKSNNNFQVFWALAQDEAEPASFSTNG
tara:strand:- start:336 stop:791 length:456 start_codon:yes stop_codon:yes gene_type:complete